MIMLLMFSIVAVHFISLPQYTEVGPGVFFGSYHVSEYAMVFHHDFDLLCFDSNVESPFLCLLAICLSLEIYSRF